MCGIAGIVGKPDSQATKRMLQATHHRGPDDSGIYENGSMVFGMNRLSIIDLSMAGHQPMHSDDGRYYIVYNGEMYNFQEEKKALEKEGVYFRSHTDTEVVLQLYIRYGKNCLSRMRGMFAFTIWDNEKKELFGARDRLGIKPLLYTIHNGNFIFCSEMKGLLASGLIKKELDLESVEQFLVVGYISPPYTIIKNVSSVLPGHCFMFTPSSGKLSISEYWDLTSLPQLDLSYEEAKSGIRKLLVSSVKEEMISDVPVGIFLSGGLDSTVITACMREAGIEKIDSFTVAFTDGSSDINESDEALATSKHFNTNHHAVKIGAAEIRNDFDNFIRSIDQPSVDGMNTYFVSKFARKNVTVALSGLGGDELFFGYGWQRYILDNISKSALIYKLTAPLYKNMLRKFLPFNLVERLDQRYSNNSFSDYYTFINRQNSPLDALKREYLATPDLNKLLSARVQAYQLDKGDDLMRKITRADMALFMSARVLRDGDATSMYHSLEARYPVIDHRLVEFVFSLPSSYKYNSDSNVANSSGYSYSLNYSQNKVKKILSDSFADVLPAGFDKREKRGFTIPVQEIMANSLQDRYNDFLDDDSFIYHSSALKKIKSANNWPLFILREWCKMNNVTYN